MDEIKNYLSLDEKDYQTGIALLQKYCKNKILVGNLAKKESSYNRDKLLYELGKLSGSAQISLPNLPILVPNLHSNPTLLVKLTESGDVVTHEVAVKVQELRAKMSVIYTDRAKLSNTLADLNTDAERKEVVDKIEALSDEYNVLFEQKRALLNPEPVKENTEPVEVKEKSIAELDLEAKSLSERMSKAKKKHLSKPDDVLLAEAFEKLKLEKEQLDIRRKLMKEAAKQLA